MQVYQLYTVASVFKMGGERALRLSGEAGRGPELFFISCFLPPTIPSEPGPFDRYLYGRNRRPTPSSVKYSLHIQGWTINWNLN